MANNDLSKIRHVQVNDPVAAEPTSQPTRAIELRLKELEGIVFGSSAASTNSQLIIPNVDIRTEAPGQVGLYNAVFFNANTGLYELAAANVTLVSGTFQANPTALAVGVVVAVRGSQADVMIGGVDSWGVDPDRTTKMNALLVEGEAGFTPGVVYYLSDTTPGQLTRYAPSLKIQVIVSSDENYIVNPIYATPEAIQNVYPLPVGMRPVGSLRTIPPDQNKVILVGFDGLEQYDAVNNQWRLTAEGDVTTFVNFGYMLADAAITTVPAAPIYVRIEVDTGGNINVYSSTTLAGLYSSSSSIFNQLTGGSALLAISSNNFDTVRVYAVKDTTNNVIGSLSFKFTAYDISLARHVIFKLPDDFQGWKAVNAAVPPYATATTNNSGQITSITVVEGSVGFTAPPTVVITDASNGPGTGAVATATINELGVITGVVVSNSGSNYISPIVSFVSTISSVQVLNGGAGATATATVVSGVITGVTITNGGTGYYLDPDVEIIDSFGVGLGAQIAASVLNGSVISATIINGGSGYNSGTPPVLRLRPKFNSGYDTTGVTTAPITRVVGQTPTGTPALTPVFSPTEIVRVDILSAGISYNTGTTITVSPNTGSAILHPVLDDLGRIIRVDVVSPGSGFTGVPTLTLANVTTGGVTGNGAQLVAVLGSFVQSITTVDPGVGLTDPVSLAVGVPVRTIEVDSGGSGYLTAPTVTIDPPDTAGITIAAGGVQATATALLGGTIARVEITNAGTGYSQSAPPAITLTGTGGTGAQLALSVGSDGTIAEIEVINPGSGYNTLTATIAAPGSGTTATIAIFLEGNSLGLVAGTDITHAGSGYVNGVATITVSAPPMGGTQAVLIPVISQDGNGSVLSVTISNPGAGYTAPPTLTVSNPTTGSDLATIVAFLDGYSVVGVSVVNPGLGYVLPPSVTIAAPPFGDTATASIKLVGGTVQNQVTISGSGGTRVAQNAPLVAGNNLQVFDYLDDFPDVSKPNNASWYYNIKADPNLKALYPAVPIDKVMFMFNGVELTDTIYNESQNVVNDPDADIAVTRRTILWTTFDQDGCPWDAAVQQYVNDNSVTGRDCIIPLTGPVGFCAVFWKLWGQVFAYEIQRNKALIHLNKASPFYQTSRVESLSALAPLRLIDTVTGTQSNNNGVPMTGQLMLVNDTEVNLFTGTGTQINLANPGELQAIFQNTTGRLVAISSFLLTVIYQNNSANLTPDASFCAQITIGTQAGNYRDIVGSSTADVFQTRLFAVNQVKEIWPDSDQPSPLIQPNQTVYLQVVQPAGSPIITQIAVARIKGNVL